MRFQDVSAAQVEIAIEQVSDRHWRVVWLDNALDVMLRDGGGGQVDDPPTLYTRLAARTAELPPEADPVFAVADALRRVDADVRVGTRRTPVAWSRMAATAEDGTLRVSLHAATAPLRADLLFRVDGTGVLVRETKIVHTGGAGEPVLLSGVPSFALALPEAFDDAVFLSGEWGEETQVNAVPLRQTPIYLESRAGRTGFEYNPWLALQAPGVTVTAQLFWSGNWHLAGRQGPGATYLSGGLPEHGFSHELSPGETLDLPAVAIVRVAGGLDAATHRLHDYRRALGPDPARDVPVQFNSWYPHPGEPDLAAMLALVPLAARLGCEVFVLDAGWYTTEIEDPAENWWTRTGDWIVNERLFPAGLEELSDACQAAGLGFGIWFEPEAVSPSSVVRREHPEWVHHIDGKPPAAGRRGVLNLGVDAAREFVRDRMIAILRRTKAVWMKWDFNTDLRQGGWASGAADAAGRDPVVAHYAGLYRLQDELRAAFPDLTLEMCSSGGGRFDGELMAHAHTNWMSDQKQSLRNLSIHFGSQLAHPPVACNDWLIEWPLDSIEGHMSRGATPDARGDLAFRLRIPMLGTLGISAPVTLWSDAEIALAARHVAWYREHVRARTKCADQYLLTPQPPLDGRGDWAAIWYADKDRSGGVGFFFRLEGAADRSFGLAGLDPGRRYRLRFLDGPVLEATGAELAAGLQIALDAPFTSVAVVIEAAD
jgi:alpha-galactosidase